MKINFLLVPHVVGHAWPGMEFQLRLPLSRLMDRPHGNTSISLLLVRDGEILAHILVDFGGGAFESIMKAGLPPLT